MESIRIVSDAAPVPVAPETPATVVTENPTGVSARPAGEVEQSTPATERPTWLPEKFADAAALATAYAELEKKMGGKPTAPTVPAVTPEAPAASGLDFSAMSAEFVKEGKLGEASVAALTAAGIPEAFVSRYAAGQQAIATQLKAEVAAVAGGEEALKSVLDWANTNADASTVATYNDAIDSGNVGLVKIATQALVAKHTEAVGTAGTRVVGESGKTAGDDAGFASNAEMVKAMSDPRYSNDQAYRNKVRARLKNTTMFGV